MDICLLEDETGSFNDDIGYLQAAAPGLYASIKAVSADAYFAVAGFRDYPVEPYGQPTDWVYRLLSGMSSKEADWIDGVAALTAPPGAGLDTLRPSMMPSWRRRARALLSTRFWASRIAAAGVTIRRFSGCW